MTSIQPIFDFQDHAVRVIIRNGQPWFIAADICRVLDIANSRDAVASLDDDEKMTVVNTDGHSGQRGGAQSFNLISESGLYALIFRSRKPEAKQFRKWVTGEVLPTLRQTGKYEGQPPCATHDPLLDRLKGRVEYLTSLGVERDTALQTALSLRKWKKLRPASVANDTQQRVAAIIAENPGATTSTLQMKAIQSGIPRATFYRAFSKIRP